jgi:two-component system phosphate regulon sensor histidine kinase PhoR
MDERRLIERWIAWVRLGAFVFAFVQVVVLRDDFPSRRYELAAWIATAALGVGAALFLWLSRRRLSSRSLARVGFVALTFDTAVVSAFVLIYSSELGTPVIQALIIPLAEAALRYGLKGGIVLPLVLAPVYAAYEWLRSDRFDHPYDVDHVTFGVGVGLIAGLFVGWLVERLRGQSELAERRAVEAEGLRDALGRRADIVDAANRCVRALSSSLDLEQAFSAFIDEVRRVVPFDGTAIVLADDGSARVIAAAGAGSQDLFRPGSRVAVPGSLVDQVLQSGQPVYRGDASDLRGPEDERLLELDLHALLAAPLVVGARAIGMLSLVRREPNSFDAQEIELVTLLGRFLGATVQNIRAYEAERETVSELRRLSSLRDDFVSLVSHELRNPLASLIGSALTLRERWRELSQDQRESFLDVIAHEGSRLTALVEDVLDASRIEAGTFTYSFGDVDIADLVNAAVAAADSAQDEVSVRADVSGSLPTVRGDAKRLRQVLGNLIDNAVKYSPAGGEVRVAAHAEDGRVLVSVSDRGPGIAVADQELVFEKFGRATDGGNTKPGTGLGLFIARSIAEEHGGAIGIDSMPDQGAVFTLSLPIVVETGRDRDLDIP